MLAYQFWGTGIFPEAARLILEFSFDTLGVHRLEARAAVPNGRGNGALVKVSIWFDQVMWSIMDYECREHEKQRRENATRSSRQIIDDIEGRTGL